MIKIDSSTKSYVLDEGQRQLAILAVAKLAVTRPGFHDALREIAAALEEPAARPINPGDDNRGRAMFDDFYAQGADNLNPPAAAPADHASDADGTGNLFGKPSTGSPMASGR